MIKDDSQMRIVEEGGVEALIEYQKQCEEEDLIDSINYSYCKLSSRDENKERISKQLPHFYELLLSNNERSVDFALQTLSNLSSFRSLFIFYISFIISI